jgi:hypothetical protein
MDVIRLPEPLTHTVLLISVQPWHKIMSIATTLGLTATSVMQHVLKTLTYCKQQVAVMPRIYDLYQSSDHGRVHFVDIKIV